MPSGHGESPERGHPAIVVGAGDSVKQPRQDILVVDSTLTENLDGNLPDGKARMLQELVQGLRLKSVLCVLCDISRLGEGRRYCTSLADEHKAHYERVNDAVAGDADAGQDDSLISDKRDEALVPSHTLRYEDVT